MPVHPVIQQKISGMLRAQKEVYVEPLLHKQRDLGFLYQIAEDGPRFIGYSRFFTNLKGQYGGNYLRGFPVGKDSELDRFTSMSEIELPGLHMDILKRLNISANYHGPLGIDSLIFRDENGLLKINPCLEINWRYTMGHVAIEIEKHLVGDRPGIFGIYFSQGVSFANYAAAMMKRYPIVRLGEFVARGFLPLTGYRENQSFGAYMLAEE
jgi:hypothetical protein